MVKVTTQLKNASTVLTTTVVAAHVRWTDCAMAHRPGLLEFYLDCPRTQTFKNTVEPSPMATSALHVGRFPTTAIFSRLSYPFTHILSLLDTSP